MCPIVVDPPESCITQLGRDQGRVGLSEGIVNDQYLSYLVSVGFQNKALTPLRIVGVWEGELISELSSKNNMIQLF